VYTQSGYGLYPKPWEHMQLRLRLFLLVRLWDLCRSSFIVYKAPERKNIHSIELRYGCTEGNMH
jgi:hypothetical protein